MASRTFNPITPLRQSDIGKRLDRFDSNPIAIALGKFLSSHPSCIKLFHLLVKKRGYVFSEDVVEYFNEEYKSAPIQSFIIQRKCKHCNLDVEYASLADLDFDATKSHSTRSCAKCRSAIHISESEYKKFQTADIWSLFLFGMRCGIFQPFQYSICPFCKNEETIGPNRGKNQIRTDCRKCGKPVEIKVSFELNKDILDNLDIVNSQGYWFEWYLGYILKNRKGSVIVKRNQIYRIGKREIEMDIIVDNKGKTSGISCSAEKEGKFDSENFHMMKKICKRLVLASPDNSIPTKIIDCAASSFKKNVSAISIADFSETDSLLKKI